MINSFSFHSLPNDTNYHSASNLDFTVPRTQTKFGDRGFSVAGWTVSNSLWESSRLTKTLCQF